MLMVLSFSFVKGGRKTAFFDSFDDGVLFAKLIKPPPNPNGG
jgi:hypothetical protein